MSVINDVLKDLEQRESRFTPLQLAGDGVAAEPPARRARWPLVLPVAALALALLAGAWLYQQDRSALSSPAPPTAAASPADSAPVRAVPPAAPPFAATVDAPAHRAAAAPVDARADRAAAAPVNAIVGLRLREAADELRIEFALRERAVAYLKQRDRNGFAYHLDGIESRIAAPDISGNRWLERLAIEPADGGVDILFATAPRVLVDTSEARGDGEVVWAISLRHAPPPAVAATPPVEATAGRPGGAAAELATGPVETSAAARAASPPKERVAAPSAGTDAASAEAAAAEPAEVRLDIRSAGRSAGDRKALRQAREMIEAGRYVDAERRLRDLLGSPQDHEARRQLLALYNGRQQPERAALLARDSAARYPGDGLFATEYARSLFRDGAYLDVIRLLAGRDALDPRQQSLLAVSFQRLGRHADAVRHFRLALAEDDGLARSWVGLGISLEQSSAFAEALESYRRALALGELNERLREFAEARSSNLRRVLN